MELGELRNTRKRANWGGGRQFHADISLAQGYAVLAKDRRSSGYPGQDSNRI
jgi:hypothetical protein